MFSIDMKGDTELLTRLKSMPEQLQSSLVRKVGQIAVDLRTYIITMKLSGQVLNHRSGKLWQSLHFEVNQKPNSVTGRVFTSGDIKYAAIHEYGGKTPPHLIQPKNADVLAFNVGGKTVFAKFVHHPGSVMPERSFMRSSLRENKVMIGDQLKMAVMEALKK